MFTTPVLLCEFEQEAGQHFIAVVIFLVKLMFFCLFGSIVFLRDIAIDVDELDDIITMFTVHSLYCLHF